MLDLMDKLAEMIDSARPKTGTWTDAAFFRMKITIRNWKTTAYYRSLPDVFRVKLRSGKEFSIHESQCEEIDD